MAKPGYKSQRRRNTRKPSVAQPGKSLQGAKKPPVRQAKAVESSADETRNRVKAAPPAPQLPARMMWVGDRLPEKTGHMLECAPDDHYALIDSGNGEKLERYGDLKIRRPEGQAIWQPSLPPDVWDQADAIFTGDTDEEGQGRWRYPKRDLEEVFPLQFDGLEYFGRFTSFRHTGVFPEQAVHWRAMEKAIRHAGRSGDTPVRVLNLFGYTGLASLVAARAGAHVTHVDASRKAIGWARENQELAELENAPIRWICDDAAKFCAREVRRGQTYDLILLDPPAYGRGPKGEVWQLFEHLPVMMDMVRQLQSPNPLMTVLTAYAIRASHFAIHELMQEVFAGMAGEIQSGELVLKQENGGRYLSTSMYSRFVGEGCPL